MNKQLLNKLSSVLDEWNTFVEENHFEMNSFYSIKVKHDAESVLATGSLESIERIKNTMERVKMSIEKKKRLEKNKVKVVEVGGKLKLSGVK